MTPSPERVSTTTEQAHERAVSEFLERAEREQPERAREVFARYPVTWEPLVTPQMFQRVIDRMAGRSHSAPGNRPRRGPRPYVLGALLYCQACGRKMSATHFPGKETYYKCGSALTLGARYRSNVSARYLCAWLAFFCVVA